MTVLFLLTYVVVGWKYGNWENFSRLYPTLLFLIIGDLLYQFLFFDYSMWMFHPVGFIDEWFGLNHTMIALGRMIIQYPVTIALFLGRMKANKKNQLFSVILWVGIFSIIQMMFHIMGGLTYQNGWNYAWDCAFTAMLFSMLLFHHKKPFFAWVLTVLIVVGLWLIFDVPFTVLK